MLDEVNKCWPYLSECAPSRAAQLLRLTEDVVRTHGTCQAEQTMMLFAKVSSTPSPNGVSRLVGKECLAGFSKATALSSREPRPLQVPPPSSAFCCTETCHFVPSVSRVRLLWCCGSVCRGPASCLALSITASASCLALPPKPDSPKLHARTHAHATHHDATSRRTYRGDHHQPLRPVSREPYLSPLRAQHCCLRTSLRTSLRCPGRPPRPSPASLSFSSSVGARQQPPRHLLSRTRRQSPAPIAPGIAIARYTLEGVLALAGVRLASRPYYGIGTATCPRSQARQGLRAQEQ